MLLALALLAVGAVVLYAGAEGAVRGAAGLARAAGIPLFVLGALLFGVDVEGVGAAAAAAARGETALAAGEIFGTVLFLFSAAFGMALLLAPRQVPSPDAVMVVAPSVHLVAAAIVLADRSVGRAEGAILLVLYALYVALVVASRGFARPRAEALEREAGEAPPSRALMVLLLLGGLLLVAAGSSGVVLGASQLAAETRLLSGYVGAAVLGVLVSLDEVLLEVLPVRRGQPELATGNLFGTVAAFSSGVLGIAALIQPLEVDGAGAAAFLGAAFLYALVATVFLVRGRAGRLLAAFVLATYAAWLLMVSRV